MFVGIILTNTRSTRAIPDCFDFIANHLTETKQTHKTLFYCKLNAYYFLLIKP